jgi:hypothetical protein
MKKLCFAAVILLCLALPHAVFGQSAKEAIRALKKVEAGVQVGITYQDYLAALRNAQFEVNLFLESPEAISKPELAKSIKEVMDLYLAASSIWKMDFIKVSGGSYESFESYLNSDEYKKAQAKSIALFLEWVQKKKEFIKNYKTLPDDRETLWLGASFELKNAMSLLNDSNKKTK